MDTLIRCGFFNLEAFLVTSDNSDRKLSGTTIEMDYNHHETDQTRTLAVLQGLAAGSRKRPPQVGHSAFAARERPRYSS